MNHDLRDYWAPKLLRLATLGLAVALAGAVVVVPWIAGEAPQHPLVVLYAYDLAVRRVSLAAAVGLAVTALVFFRPRRALRPPESKPGPPTNVAGA